MINWSIVKCNKFGKSSVSLLLSHHTSSYNQLYTIPIPDQKFKYGQYIFSFIIPIDKFMMYHHLPSELSMLVIAVFCLTYLPRHVPSSLTPPLTFTNNAQIKISNLRIPKLPISIGMEPSQFKQKTFLFSFVTSDKINLSVVSPIIYWPIPANKSI